jgi:hypothetical protein
VCPISNEKLFAKVSVDKFNVIRDLAPWMPQKMFYPEMTPQSVFFERIDFNGDSIIDPLEFKQVHMNMDTDSNNKISLSEFIEWLGDDKIRMCSCC